MRTALKIRSEGEKAPMETRIARLESDVAHIQKDVAELKTDFRSLSHKADALRDKLDSSVTEIRQSIAKLSIEMEQGFGKLRVSILETRVWSLIKVGGILLLMARAFKWI
jgi:uncharacterized coiled-coil protein SlyX